MIKKLGLFFVLAMMNMTLYAYQLENFSYDGIDYQWDVKDKREEALQVYVHGFQVSYIELGLGDCQEHFNSQTKIEMNYTETNPHNHWLIALDKDKVVGVAMFEFDNYPNLYFRELAVLPEYRRQKIATHLTMGPFRNNKIEKISIVTRRANKPAVAFFSSLNYKENDYMHPDYDPQRYIGMELFLKD